MMKNAALYNDNLIKKDLSFIKMQFVQCSLLPRFPAHIYPRLNCSEDTWGHGLNLSCAATALDDDDKASIVQLLPHWNNQTSVFMTTHNQPITNTQWFRNDNSMHPIRKTNYNKTPAPRFQPQFTIKSALNSMFVMVRHGHIL